MTKNDAIDLLQRTIDVLNEYLTDVEEFQVCETARKEAERRIECYTMAIIALKEKSNDETND